MGKVKARKKRRKSLRKEALKVTVEGKETRIHFTLEETKLEQKKFNPNPNLIPFGTIGVANKHQKAYAFKNNPKLVFFRINDQFIPMNKHKLREMVALCSKGAWFIGLYGKRAKKYTRKLKRLKKGCHYAKSNSESKLDSTKEARRIEQNL